MEATDLAGLTPDQVAQVMGTRHQGEALRQQAVSTLLGLPKEQAQTALLQAQTRALETEPELKLALESIKQAKTPEEITKIKADTYRAMMAGDLDAATAQERISLLDAKATAAKLGNEKLQQEIDNRIEMTFPGGVTGKVTPKDYLEALTRTETARMGAAGKAGDLGAEKFKVQQEQTAVDIEGIILKDPESPEALSRYEDFNRYTNRPKVAYNDDGEVKFIDLPRVGGKVVTGKMLADAAAKFGLTVDDLAKAANYNGPAMLMILQQLGAKAKAGGK